MGPAGIVLCGGRSSRMGRAKAWLPWRGRPMVVHVVDVLRAAALDVVVVASAALALPPVDAAIVRDREPDLGPLAGIREGLSAIRADLAFVTSTDAPFLTPAFVAAMLAHGCAAAPVLDGFVQTLGAVYPRAARERAEALIAAGRLRPLNLLEALDFRRVSAAELPDVDSVRGFNTPGEYLAAVRETDPEAAAILQLAGGARRATGRRELAVPVGTLAEVLAHLRPAIEALDGECVAPAFQIWLDAVGPLCDGAIPIGPGERVVVCDASDPAAERSAD